jgi:SAM-dependent methyltransferase
MNLKNTFSDYLAACPACDSPVIQPWLTKEMGGVTFKLDRCCVCGTGYVNPRPSMEYLQSIYAITGHGSKSLISFDEVMAAEIEFPNSTVDAQRIIDYAQTLLGPRKNLQLLDIGSGYGFFSRAGIAAGFQVTAVNPASSENSIFKQLNGFEPIPRFFEEVDLGAAKFDLVILSQILEHFLDPRQILIRVNSLLNRGGVVAIAVPNIDAILIKILKSRSSFLGLPEHLTHFSFKGLEAILQRTGFAARNHLYVSRIPYNSLSNKLGLQGKSRQWLNRGFRIAQWLPLKIADWLGCGLYQNVWAQPASGVERP